MNATLSEDTQRLHHTMRDLLALSVVWAEREPGRIAEELAELLLDLLQLELCLVRLTDAVEAGTRDVVRTGPRFSSAEEAIRSTLAAWLDNGPVPPRRIVDPLGEGWITIASLPIGPGGECGKVVVGSKAEGFPTDLDSLRMDVALSQAAIVLQRWWTVLVLRKGEETRRRMAAIVEGCEDAIIGKLLDGRIESWNRGAERLYGYTADEVIGRPISILLPPERADELPGIFERLRRGERIEPYDTVRMRKDGQRIDVSVTISPIRDGSGRIVGASAIARDISDRKRAEEALREADRRKDEFLALLSHELRNPLAPIRNAVTVLKCLGIAEPRHQRAVEVIDRQVTHQTRLIGDLLDVSRISRGKVRLRPERLDLVTLIRNTSEDYRASLEEAGITPSEELPAEPVWVEGDATRLAQVLGNLLHNAWKFTERGGFVTVRLIVAPGTQQACVTVTDTGMGIDAEVLPHVFESFTQADRSLERSRGGLGLGLALVKGLVELHGGEVEASSEGTGRGAVFAFRLPMLADAPVRGARCAVRRENDGRGEPCVRPGRTQGSPLHAERQADASTAHCALRTAHRLSILLIEDHADTAETLSELLDYEGHTVCMARSGVDGVALARRMQPEVVLCDLGLPGLDGCGVARALREDATTAGARLIAITGYGQVEDERRCREAGFDVHLTKPVEFGMLLRLLEGAREYPPAITIGSPAE